MKNRIVTLPWKSFNFTVLYRWWPLGWTIFGSCPWKIMTNYCWVTKFNITYLNTIWSITLVAQKLGYHVHKAMVIFSSFILFDPFKITPSFNPLQGLYKQTVNLNTSVLLSVTMIVNLSTRLQGFRSLDKNKTDYMVSYIIPCTLSCSCDTSQSSSTADQRGQQHPLS